MMAVFKGDERVLEKRKKPNTDRAWVQPNSFLFFSFFDKPVNEFERPSVTAIYIDCMNGVDRGDQTTTSQAYGHSSCRGAWHALTWAFLLGVALMNGYLA
jgi:hypothetical protein